MGKEFGFYAGPEEESFVSRKDIMSKSAQDGVKFITPRSEGKDFPYWSERLKNSASAYQETKEVLSNHIEIRLPEKSAIAFWGDHHVGSGETNYDRIEEEMYRIVATPNMYVIMLGDSVDGFFFNPPQMEAAEQPPVQYAYIESMINHLGKHKKLLAGFGGDHDGWAKKMGVNAIKGFTEASGAYYMNGVGYISIYIGEQEYKITAAHRLPGSSIYNNVHPERRALNEGARGSDIIVGGHTHRKGVASQAVKEFGGSSRTVHLHSVGPYKSTDDYARKLGFAEQSSEDMFGTAIILSKDRFHIRDYDDIIDASKDIWSE